MRRNRWSALGLSFAIVAVLAPPGVMAQSGNEAATRLTSAAHVTNANDEAPGHSYTSPTVVVDPEDPLRVYAASVDVRAQRCVFVRSADGGRTWVKGEGSPSLDAYPFCTHDNGFVPLAFLAMGRDGRTLYFAHIGWDTQDGGRAENRSIFLGRSTDFGDSWEVTTVRNNRGKTGNDIEKNVVTGLAVDITTGTQDTVYVAFTASFPNPTSPARPGQPMVATSVDGGRTFGEPANLSGSFFDDVNSLPSDIAADKRVKANFGGGGSYLTVDTKGQVFASWTRGSANITPIAPPPALYLSRSSDQGKTFTVSEVLAANPDQTGPTGAQVRWSPEGGVNGSLHATWEGRPVTAQGDRDVLYRRSLDGGATWGDIVRLNDDDPVQLFSQFQPSLGIAPDGRLDVVWWDMRDNAGRFVTDVYYAYSTDNGSTWSDNVRVTDRSIDRNLGIWKPGTGGDVRQPPGVGSSDRLAHVIWDDTRNGTAQTETQDLYTVAVQFEALPAGGLPRGVGYLLAIVIGVGAVGVLLMVGALGIRSRRPSDPPAAETIRGKEPAGVS